MKQITINIENKNTLQVIETQTGVTLIMLDANANKPTKELWLTAPNRNKLSRYSSAVKLSKIVVSIFISVIFKVFTALSLNVIS